MSVCSRLTLSFSRTFPVTPRFEERMYLFPQVIQVFGAKYDRWRGPKFPRVKQISGDTHPAVPARELVLHVVHVICGHGAEHIGAYRAIQGFRSLGQVHHDHVPAMPVDPFGAEPAYLQVANDVERRINAGEFTRKLPAERALAEEYGSADTTVRHAMAILRERGVIRTADGRGTFVVEDRPT